VPYPYLGATTRIYVQYLDGDGGHTLTAEPGGIYDPVPAQGAPEDLAVPPADGLWGPETKPAPKGRAGKAAAAAAGED
jgi:hypothetical protein